MSTVLVHVEEITNAPEPAALCNALRELPYPFLLESGMSIGEFGRYSFVGAGPSLVLRAKGERLSIEEAGRVTERRGNPFEALDQALRSKPRTERVGNLPFAGAAVGYLAYDLCHWLEKLPRTAVDDILMPDMYFAFYEAAVVYDHTAGSAFLAWLNCEQGAMAQRGLREALASARPLDAPREAQLAGGPLQGNFTHDEYLRAVQAAKDYIAAGDIYQVNLSQRFEAPLAGTAWDLYCTLRRLNPAPFAAYLGYPDGLAVVSASPERFLLLLPDGRVQTRPIKGTRPRGRTPEEDRRLADELLASEKDRAELLMITDLERNDLGRVCKIGSVTVPNLFTLESYPTVHHLVATVEGQLEEGRGPVDLLRASFPGGSITGAPKIRAMEIIDELEPTQRAVYTGSLGYIGYDGGMDLNIVIRTFIVTRGRAYFQVGGGIVADSDPEAEYQETLDKGRALAASLGLKL